MFEPTHWLVSRTRRVPVLVKAQGEKSLIFTEFEWDQTPTPAFELHSKMGMYCRGVQVLGYTLEPFEAASMATASPLAEASFL